MLCKTGKICERQRETRHDTPEGSRSKHRYALTGGLAALLFVIYTHRLP
jgi:hypothetical protein